MIKKISRESRVDSVRLERGGGRQSSLHRPQDPFAEARDGLEQPVDVVFPRRSSKGEAQGSMSICRREAAREEHAARRRRSRVARRSGGGRDALEVQGREKDLAVRARKDDRRHGGQAADPGGVEPQARNRPPEPRLESIAKGL